jgi:hypothetical protein
MATASGHDWDAATYDRISEPRLQWAREQLERLEGVGTDESDTVADRHGPTHHAAAR